jgi:hypothetical protein
LPKRCRAPLLLCYLEGRTQDEAAKQLGWSISTLRRRLEGGRELLRARRIRRGATLGAALFAGFLAPLPVRATLTAPLRKAVLTAVRGGTGITPTVLALVDGGMRMALLTRISLWLTIAEAVGAVLAGLVWQRTPATQAVQSRQAPPADPLAEQVGGEKRKQPAAGHDLFNDLLPKGAVARLGTIAFRHGPGGRTHSPTC